MNGRFFLDSNVLLYLLEDNASAKKEVAVSLIDKIGFLSPQVLFECLNVCIRKKKLDRPKAVQFVLFLLKSSYLQHEDQSVAQMALKIFDRYQLQVFDSKIVASALHAGCTTLYSEDMQHGLVIEKKLIIVNPFL